MPERFSERYGYNKVPLQKIIDDAPQRIRDAFVDLILKGYIYIDRDSRYVKGNAILGAKALYEEITSTLLISRDEDYYDSWRILDILYSLIRTQVEWNEFYDIVEYIGKQLIWIDEIRSKQKVDIYQSTWTFEEYQGNVNSLFNRGGIGWRLDDNSELKLDVPKELSDGIEKTEEILAQQKPSLGHVEKALKFLTDYHAIDPENAIKEIVSAIEAFGNSIWPKTNTLGDIIKEMRKADFPANLVSTIEKFYAFASDEPGIRHGKNRESRLNIVDAELCVYIGVAIIRYLKTYIDLLNS